MNIKKISGKNVIGIISLHSIIYKEVLNNGKLGKEIAVFNTLSRELKWVKGD